MDLAGLVMVVEVVVGLLSVVVGWETMVVGCVAAKMDLSVVTLVSSAIYSVVVVYAMG